MSPVPRFLFGFKWLDLNWDLHIEDLSCKIAKSIGIIVKSRYFLPTNVLASLYCIIVSSTLTFHIAC